MDVSDPSNFVRILELMNHDDERLKSLVSADRISDDETIATMKEVYRQYGYVLDPHGAVAYLALERWLREHPSEYGIFFGDGASRKISGFGGVGPRQAPSHT
jgi:threonine synthase